MNDMYDDEGRRLPFTVWESRGVKSSSIMKWMGLITATQCRVQNIQQVHRQNETLCLAVNSAETPLAGMNCKAIYQELLESKVSNTVHVPRVMKFIDSLNVNWSNIYEWANNIPIDIKTRNFQYRFIHDILVNNYWLHKWGLKENPDCTSCGQGADNMLHLFWSCVVVKRFWTNFEDFYKNHVGPITLTKDTVFLGTNDHMMYKLTVLAKRYIYNKRIHGEELPIAGYIALLKKIKCIELQMAKERDRMDIWIETWGAIDV